MEKTGWDSHNWGDNEMNSPQEKNKKGNSDLL